MKTKLEIIAELKAENPVIKIGSDEAGYSQLTKDEYEAKIAEWADSKLAQEADIATEAAFAKDRADGLAKLEAVGLTAAQARAVARKGK